MIPDLIEISPTRRWHCSCGRERLVCGYASPTWTSWNRAPFGLNLLRFEFRSFVPRQVPECQSISGNMANTDRLGVRFTQMR